MLFGAPTKVCGECEVELGQIEGEQPFGRQVDELDALTATQMRDDLLVHGGTLTEALVVVIGQERFFCFLPVIVVRACEFASRRPSRIDGPKPRRTTRCRISAWVLDRGGELLNQALAAEGKAPTDGIASVEAMAIGIARIPSPVRDLVPNRALRERTRRRHGETPRGAHEVNALAVNEQGLAQVSNP